MNVIDEEGCFHKKINKYGVPLDSVENGFFGFCSEGEGGTVKKKKATLTDPGKVTASAAITATITEDENGRKKFEEDKDSWLGLPGYGWQLLTMNEEKREFEIARREENEGYAAALEDFGRVSCKNANFEKQFECFTLVSKNMVTMLSESSFW